MRPPSGAPPMEGSIPPEQLRWHRCRRLDGRGPGGGLRLAAPGGRFRLLAPPWLRQERAFWPCELRRDGALPSAPGLIHHHRSTWDPAEGPGPVEHLEVLVSGEAAPAPGDWLELGVDGRSIGLIPVTRLRARLLEFLKFRVLAAQLAFFADAPADPGGRAAELRGWLRGLGVREFEPLSDADLLEVLATARWLYTETEDRALSELRP
jgi:hypothetical protein